MGKIKKILAGLMVSTMAISMAGCNMIEKTPEAIQKTVLAKVGDNKILRSDVDEQLESITESLKSTYGDDYESKIDDSIKTQLATYRKQALTKLVEQQVLLQKADELKLVPAEDELNKKVDDEVAQVVAQFENEDAYKAALEQANLTEEGLRKQAREQVIIELVTNDMFKDIAASDDEIKDYYDKNIDTFTTKPSASVKHILFETEEEAKAVKDAIDAGTTTFDAEYAKYEANKASGTKPLAEDLGTVAYDQQGYDTAFLDGLKNVGEGQVSEPVKSSFGYHLIFANNIDNEEKVSTLDEVKDTIKSQVEYQKQKDTYTETLDKWKKELKVKTYEDRL